VTKTLEDVAEIKADDLLSVSVGADKGHVRQSLRRHGWCLVRRAAASTDDFHNVIVGLGFEPADHYGDLPSFGHRNIFRTTPYPPDMELLFHNEAAHTPAAPQHIFFFCQHPARKGGATPLSNGVDALERLDVQIANALKQKGLIYRRRFIPGLDVAWSDFFGTTDKGEVERQCTDQGLSFAWLDGDILQTEYKTVATGLLADGRTTMFHQIALHHPAFLPVEVREYFTSYDDSNRTPREVLLGDGSELSDHWALAIVDAQIEASHFFQWQAGDILILDNRIMAHARATYSGERENYAILGKLKEIHDVWDD
jgi:Taurine catabolism dioxygenase TauD, TfdA family